MLRVKITILILGIFGIVFGAIGVGDTIKIMKEDFKSIEEEDNGKLEPGDLAKGNIYWAYDKVAVHKSSRSYGGIPMGSSEVPYYVVELTDRFIVVSAGSKDVQNQIEKLTRQTVAYDKAVEAGVESPVEPTPVELTTKVVDMPDKVREYLKEYCMASGYDDAKYAELVDDSCVLNCVQYDSMKWIPFIGFGIGALFILIFVIMVIKGRGKTVYVGETNHF